MSVDPSHYLPAANGGKPPLLKLQNISARPELNGTFGQAVSFSAGRYVVALIDSTIAAAQATGNGNDAQPTFLKLKPENLTEAGNLDQLKFGASMMAQSAKAYIASPTMQNIGKLIIDKMPPALQSKMTPNRALLGLAIGCVLLLYILWIILGKLFGFNKMIVFTCLITLLLAVSSPDWMEGYKANKPMKLIAKNVVMNFRMRWKDNLVNITGYNNISDNMALASLVFILLFSGKILMTRSPTHLPSMSMGDNINMQRSVVPQQPQYDLEYIYKLGYDDHKAGNEFGTSLPDDIIKVPLAISTTQDGYNENNNFDYDDYNPPLPPPRKSSSLGMGTLLSMFTLYRFGKDLVTSPDGQIVLDPQYIMARMRGIETWRLGMLAMSLYRVVTALSSFVR